DTSPVEVEASAPPADAEVTGLWAWVELKYADGLTFVMDSTEWGTPYDRKKPRGVSLNDLSEEDRKKVKEMPDPAPLLSFAEGVRARTRRGGARGAAQGGATILPRVTLSIRVGGKIHYARVKGVIGGGGAATRLITPPMRAPWHL